MMKRLVLFLSFLSLHAIVTADLRVPAIFSDQMVLQREQANRVWGWDEPGTQVRVSLPGQSYVTTANSDGEWEVFLKPMAADTTGFSIEITGSSKRTLNDVLVGEVWLCSGQSNMFWSIARCLDGDLAAAAMANPRIRLITVPRTGTQEPQTDFQGAWTAATPEAILEFSAVGFYFGEILHRALDIPVGLIHCSWGGSSAEAWVPRGLIENDPRFAAEMDSWRAREAEFDFEQEQARYRERLDTWRTRAAEAEKAGKPAPQRPRAPANILEGQQRPGNLYAGMLNPVIGYGMRGVIWYQGENNAPRHENYHDLFTLLINTWRDAWGQGDFPFYWVQLADYRAEQPEPGESDWAALREAQTKTLESVPNGGQAVIIDLGEAKDIHPRNKRDVAYRLARWALANDYGFDIAFRSPEVGAIERKGDRVLVTFDHAGGGLRPFDVREVQGFALAGSDGVFHWAEAQVVGKDQVEVWTEAVANPESIRYAWADNPVCNLFSLEGLPATPFSARIADFTIGN